jgi:D-alanine-D-alanine ligase
MRGSYAPPVPASLLIGLAFETPETYARRAGDPADYAAEYEPLDTVVALEDAITAIGHRSVRLGAPHHLLAAIGKGELPPIDVALSIAEGRGSRNREAWVPTLLEMVGVPLLGSDALTLSTSLDKAWTLDRVSSAGVPVLPYTVLEAAAARRAPLPAAFPLFVKPRWEGTSKGISASSRCEDRDALVRQVERIARDYAQPALVEAFAPGAEFTVTVVGNDPPRALPVLQRALEQDTAIGLHALERAGGPPRPAGGYRFELPGALDGELEASLQCLAVRAHEALECRDFTRIDFKLDGKGSPRFLELNPLPTFAPGGSFGILAELAGRPYADWLGEVLAAGLSRLGLHAVAP